jgi:hypothetical protein
MMTSIMHSIIVSNYTALILRKAAKTNKQWLFISTKGYAINEAFPVLGLMVYQQSRSNSLIIHIWPAIEPG